MRRLAAACLAAWIGSAALAAARQSAPAQPTGALSGVVVDAVTGRPVPGALVSLGDLDDRTNTQPRMATDARGRFVFPDLKPSSGYYLGARRFGYTYTRYGWTKPNQSLATSAIARIAVRAGQWVDDITMPLWRLGSISGRVVDERGEPVAGTAVRIFTTRPISGQPNLVAGPIAVTDDRGVYRIADLEPGRYVVGVLSVQSTVLATTLDAPMRLAVGELATGGIGGSSGTTVGAPTIDVDGRYRLALTNFATPPPPASGARRAYPAVFHPSARTQAGAVPIDLDYGDSRSDVDFQLQPEPAVSVSGRLVSPDGTFPRFLLRLMPAGSERLGFGSEAATTTVDQDGTFTFLNVSAGDYTLLAQASVMDFTTGSESTRFPDAPGFPGGGISVGSLPGAPGLGYLSRRGQPQKFWSRVHVTVGQSDISDLEVPLRPAVSIRGHVELAPGTEAQPRLLMSAEPADGDPSLGSQTGATSATDPARPFSLDGLFGGRYLVTNFNGLGVVSAMWNGRDLRDTGFDTSLGRDFDDVVVTLTDALATIDGRVSSPAGTVAGIIAFPADPARWTGYGWRAPGFHTGRAAPDGTYKLERLLAGEYLVIAVDAEQIDRWTEPDFLAAAAPLATRVAVGWGDTRTQALSVREVRVR